MLLLLWQPHEKEDILCLMGIIFTYANIIAATKAFTLTVTH